MAKEKKNKVYRSENRFDPYTTRDVIAKFITDEILSKPQNKENHKFANFKCLFGILITFNVIFSHFHYIPYPEDYYILCVCVFIYYTSTYVYQRYEQKVEGDIFIAFNQNSKTLGFGAEFPLYQPIITLTVYDLPNRGKLSQTQINVGDIFDEKGYIVESKVRQITNQLLDEATKK
ncbi:hypothetical protein pb186bvf_006264 [Paramecium bursaria]